MITDKDIIKEIFNANSIENHFINIKSGELYVWAEGWKCCNSVYIQNHPKVLEYLKLKDRQTKLEVLSNECNR